MVLHWTILSSSPDKTKLTYLSDGFVLSFTHCGRCLRFKDISEKRKKKTLHSLRPLLVAERKSRHVQEPPRKDGKMYAFIEEQNKNMDDVRLISFFHLGCNRLWRWKLTELVQHFRKLRQFLNWGKTVLLTPLIKTFKFVLLTNIQKIIFKILTLYFFVLRTSSVTESCRGFHTKVLVTS